MSTPRTVQLTCPVCGKNFNITPSNFRERMRHGAKSLYCSQKCFLKHNKGTGKGSNIAKYIKSHPNNKKWTQHELAVMFGLSRERIRQIRQELHLEAYIKARIDTQNIPHLCKECGKLVSKNPNGSYNRYCSRECRFIRRRTTIELVCHECGKKFTLDKSQYNNTMKIRRLPYRFCSKKCFGKYMGNNYGFAAHPENARPRKYDYDAVAKLTNDGFTPRQISERLSIPINRLYTLRSILKLSKIRHPSHKYDTAFINSIKGLYASQHTPKDISKILGIPISSLYSINYRYNLSRLIQRRACRKYDYNAISDMYKKGFKPKDIIAKLDIHSSVLTKINRKLGLPRFTKRVFDHDAILALHNDKYNTKQIAEKLNMKPSTVYGILYKYGKN